MKVYPYTMSGAEERERLAERQNSYRKVVASGRRRFILFIQHTVNVLTRRTIYRWYDVFERERVSANLRGGLGAPVSKLIETTINPCRALLMEDPSFTLVELASNPSILDISVRSAHHLLTKRLGYSKLTRSCAQSGCRNC